MTIYKDKERKIPYTEQEILRNPGLYTLMQLEKEESTVVDNTESKKSTRIWKEKKLYNTSMKDYYAAQSAR